MPHRFLHIDLSLPGLVLFLGVLLTLVFLVVPWPLVVLLIIAAMFAAALLPVVDWLTHHHLPRVVAVRYCSADRLPGPALPLLPASVNMALSGKQDNDVERHPLERYGSRS